MISLRELQRSFMGVVLGSDDAGTLARDCSTPSRHLAIYRNNAMVGFRKALQATYPVLLRLSGEDWFNQICDRYHRDHPSVSGDLNHVGEHLAEELGRYLAEAGGDAAAESFGYFADIARLEWAHAQVASDGDVGPVDFAGLEQLAAGGGRFSFVLNPTARLLHSPFPILDIWKANRSADTPPVIALDAGGCALLILKRGAVAGVISLSARERQVFELLTSDTDFDTLVESLPEPASASEALAALIRAHAIIGYHQLTHGDFYVN